MAADRYLYLARHGEANEDETALTGAGRRQAAALGDRLRGVPLAAIHHGPLARAAQTAALVAERLDGAVPLHESAEAGDYVPHVPEPAELPADSRAFTHERTTALAAGDEFPDGPRLADAALRRFTGPAEGDAPRHELLVTHNFLVGWLVRAAIDAPPWRWVGINQGNAALTVIRYAPGRPASVLVHNDTAHLPAELRWTGFPPELRV